MKYQTISESLWYIFVLAAKGMTYHVNIAKVIFLIAWRWQVIFMRKDNIFLQESWPGIFSDGCIINNNIHSLMAVSLGF